GFPSLRLGRAIARVENGIHDVRVIEGLHRLTTAVHRIEHVREHVDVSERTRLVAYRKQPSGFDLRLLRDVAARAAFREHLETRAQPVIEPDCALSAADFIPQIHPSLKGPAHLDLPDRAALEPNQPDAVDLGSVR